MLAANIARGLLLAGQARLCASHAEPELRLPLYTSNAVAMAKSMRSKTKRKLRARKRAT